MIFIQGITILLLFQLAGEVLTRLLGLSIPGPVFGMAALFALLLLYRQISQPLSEAADGLHSHLALLFVPAGVGVITHLQRIGEEWLPIIVTLFASALIGMSVTALLLNWLVKKFNSGEV